MRLYETKGRLVYIRKGFSGKFIVAGDLHGDLGAFKDIRKLFLRTKDSLLIFLGDYADRGNNGLEVIESVKGLIDNFGDRVIALKGNHEDYKGGMPHFSPCDLMFEVESKRKIKWTDFFPKFKHDFLTRLPLAVIIPGFALLVHGGISSKIQELSDLENPTETVEKDILWSDPCVERGEYFNPRGAGVLFGPDVSKAVAKRIGVKFFLRGHEPRKALNGPFLEHSGRILTLNSTHVFGKNAFVLTFRLKPPPTSEELCTNVVPLSLEA